MSLVNISFNTYNYLDSGHWQAKPREKRPMLLLVLLSNSQTQLILATTIKEYKENRILITRFYIVKVNMFLLKIGKDKVKLAEIMTFIISQNKKTRGRVAPE